MSLTDKLNKGQVEVVQFTSYQDYTGSIPKNIPGIKLDGRRVSGGNIVLKERLDALKSKDKDRIAGWGENYFDLADACVCFEDLVKLQPDSPLLTGIMGVVKTQDGLYVAIDAKAVESAIAQGNMKYFKVSGSETASYRRDGKIQQASVSDVVLLPYNRHSVSFTPDQFKAINGSEIKRADILYNKDMRKKDIVKDGKVIHPAWKIFSPEVIVPLVNETFKYSKEYNYDTNMGFFLPSSEPSQKAEGRALCVGRLYSGSGLAGYYGLGNDSSRLVGVVEKGIEGAAQKFDPAYTQALQDMISKSPVLHTPHGDYVLAVGKLAEQKR